MFALIDFFLKGHKHQLWRKTLDITLLWYYRVFSKNCNELLAYVHGMGCSELGKKQGFSWPTKAYIERIRLEAQILNTQLLWMQKPQ